MFVQAQIGPHLAKKQQSKVRLVGNGLRSNAITAPAEIENELSLSIVEIIENICHTLIAVESTSDYYRHRNDEEK